MNNNIYINDTYLNNNRSYHLEDSEFKWKNIKKIIKNNLSQNKINEFTSVTEVGCGAGKIIFLAKNSNFFRNSTFHGYDINEKIILEAQKKYSGVNYHCKNFINEDHKTNLLVCADVFEHIDDKYFFLKKIIKKS